MTGYPKFAPSIVLVLRFKFTNFGFNISEKGFSKNLYLKSSGVEINGKLMGRQSSRPRPRAGRAKRGRGWVLRRIGSDVISCPGNIGREGGEI